MPNGGETARSGEKVWETFARLIEDFCERSETKSPMSGQCL